MVGVVIGVEPRESGERFDRHLRAVRDGSDGFEHGPLVGRDGECDTHVVELVFGPFEIRGDAVEKRERIVSVLIGSFRERDRKYPVARDSDLYVPVEIRELARVNPGRDLGVHMVRVGCG